MNNIKFRIYRQDSKKFTYDLSPALDQYIGMNDCHGKEIYEGDIVSVPYEPDKFSYYVIKKGIVQRKVNDYFIDIPSFYFELIGDSNVKVYPMVENWKGVHDLEIMTIIGNIYENPKLLDIENLN
jgi:uncharacterized phage protein (TIGR01671 family)